MNLLCHKGEVTEKKLLLRLNLKESSAFWCSQTRLLRTKILERYTQVLKEKLELANDENIRIQTELAMVKAKYKNLKGRYNAWWAKLETWTEKQTKEICVLCCKERPLSSPVPLMATHLDASTEEFVGIAAVTPAHVPSQVTSSGAIATLVPHETSLLVASTLYIASTDVPAVGIPL